MARRSPPVGVAVNVEGIPELRRLFNRSARTGIPLSMKSANKDIGTLVLTKAKPKVARLSGSYAESLRASNTSWVAQVRAGGKRKAPYAPIIHWGSAYRPNNPPRPVIQETAVELADRIQRLYERQLQSELSKISAD